MPVSFSSAVAARRELELVADAGKPGLVVGRSSNGHFVNSFRDSLRHGGYLKEDKETRRNVDESARSRVVTVRDDVHHLFS